MNYLYKFDTIDIEKGTYSIKEIVMEKNIFKEARLAAGLTRAAMSELMEIPLRTLENWESGNRIPPKYVERWVLKELKEIESRIRR